MKYKFIYFLNSKTKSFEDTVRTTINIYSGSNDSFSNYLVHAMRTINITDNFELSCLLINYLR